MRETKALYFGGALVALVVVVAGAFWLLRSSEPTPPLTAMSPAAALDAPADEARTPIPLDHPDPIPMSVYQSPTCGCCGAWVEFMEANGFEAQVHYREDIGQVKYGFGIPPELSSCHTAVVNGYIVEGHVPVEDVRRFLAEAPAVRGITVPGMPIGSQGMEAPDGRVHYYEVYTFTSRGEIEVFATHGPVAPES